MVKKYSSILIKNVRTILQSANNFSDLELFLVEFFTVKLSKTEKFFKISTKTAFSLRLLKERERLIMKITIYVDF